MSYKLIIAVRTDLDLGKGKVAAQVGHASVEAALGSKARRKDAFEAWMQAGQPKVVVKISSESELRSLMREAGSKGIPFHVVRDAGRTQVDPGTVTCCAFGPARGQDLDGLTGHLKLL